MNEILVSTMNDLPGYEVVAVHGEVFGLIVRARNVFSNIGASFRTISSRHRGSADQPSVPGLPATRRDTIAACPT